MVVVLRQPVTVLGGGNDDAYFDIVVNQRSFLTLPCATWASGDVIVALSSVFMMGSVPGLNPRRRGMRLHSASLFFAL